MEMEENNQNNQDAVGMLRSGKTYLSRQATSVNIEELEDLLQIGASQDYTLHEIQLNDHNISANVESVKKGREKLMPLNSTVVEGGLDSKWDEQLDHSEIMSSNGDIIVGSLNEEDEVLVNNQYNSTKNELNLELQTPRKLVLIMGETNADKTEDDVIQTDQVKAAVCVDNSLPPEGSATTPVIVKESKDSTDVGTVKETVFEEKDLEKDEVPVEIITNGKDDTEPEKKEEENDGEGDQYRVLVAEIRKALKPDLDANKLEVTKLSKVINEEKTGVVAQLTGLVSQLSDPKSGLVPRLSAAETTLAELNKKVTTPKTGISARLDRIEGFAKNDEKSLSVRLGVLEGSVNAPATGALNHLKVVEDMLDSPEDGLHAVFLKMSDLQTDVNGADGLTQKMDRVSEDLKGLSEAVENIPTEGVKGEIPVSQSYKRKYEEIQQENKTQNQKLNTACGIIQVMSKQIHTLQSQTAANAAKHMSNDLIIAGIKISEKEDPFQATAEFFADRLNIEFDIDHILDAYRGGYATEKLIRGASVKIPPVMFVHLTEHLRRLVLRNTWKLTDVKQMPEGYGMYIRQALPEGLRAVRKKFSGYTERIKHRNKGKKDAKKTRYWFAGERFFVDGSVITERISAPTAQDVLNVTDIQKTQMAAIKLFRSQEETESNSVFQAFGIETDDTELAKLAFLKIKIKMIHCDHLMMAYRIVRDNKLIQGSVSDGEHFGDLEILELLKRKERANVVIFVSREYGGVHLGRRRFQIIKQVAETVLDHVGGKHLPQPASEVGSSGSTGPVIKYKQNSGGSGRYNPKSDRGNSKGNYSRGGRGNHSGYGGGSGRGGRGDYQGRNKIQGSAGSSYTSQQRGSSFDRDGQNWNQDSRSRNRWGEYGNSNRGGYGDHNHDRDNHHW